MNTNQDAYLALGEAIFEQLVVRAGILQGQTPAASAIHLSLEFEVRSEADNNSIVVCSERVGATPLKLQVQLQSTD